MKDTLGLIVLVIIVLGSVVFAVKYFKDSQYNLLKKIGLSFLVFIGCIVAAYLILGIIGGIFWVIAWIGILIREILQWIIEALLSPLRWILS